MTLQHQSHKERVDSGPGFDRLNTTRKASIKTRRLFASASDAYRAELLGFDPQAEDDDDQ